MIKNKIKKSLGVILFGIMVITFTIAPLEVEASKPVSKRLSGSDRFSTSVEISKDAYETSEIAVLASNDGHADALTGTIFAYSKNAPLLLIKKNEVPKEVKDRLESLGVEKIYLLGGEKVISRKVESKLNEIYQVERLAGSNRQETAIKIKNEVSEVNDEIFLADGYNSLVDVLSAGPISAKTKSPILLAKKDDITKETLQEINRIKPKKITIVGGLNAVSEKVENQIPKGIEVERVQGRNREETSLKLVKKFYKNEDVSNVIISNGYTIADALSGGYYSAKTSKPILLTKKDNAIKGIIDYTKDSNLDLTVLGGNRVISENLVKILLGEATEPKEDEKPLKPELGEDPVKPTKPTGPVSTIAKNEKELLDIVGRALDNREKKFEATYYGKGLDTFESFTKLLHKLRSGGTYNKVNFSGLQSSYMQYEKEGKIEIKAYDVEYRTTDKEEEKLDFEVAKVIKDKIRDGMSEEDKVRVLHNHIVDTVNYTSDTKSNSGGAYSALVNKEGVCGAYSMALSRLLDGVGIENMYVSGHEGGVRHAWNKVKVDNEWYNVDTTFAPGVDFGFATQDTYKYFLKSDKEFYEDQVKVPLYIKELPKSTSTKYDGNNFYGTIHK